MLPVTSVALSLTSQSMTMALSVPRCLKEVMSKTENTGPIALVTQTLCRRSELTSCTALRLTSLRTPSGIRPSRHRLLLAAARDRLPRTLCPFTTPSHMIEAAASGNADQQNITVTDGQWGRGTKMPRKAEPPLQHESAVVWMRMLSNVGIP